VQGNNSSLFGGQKIQVCEQNVEFLGAFSNVRKAPISFVMSIRPSVCPHGSTRLPLDGFAWDLILEFFRKSVEKIQVLLKSDKNNGYFT
jgi:hypothetical protein